MASRPAAVSVTSFNEWGEGTQIEAAVPKEVSDAEHAAALEAGDGNYEATLRATGVGRAYKSYAPLRPSAYLERTAYWEARLRKDTLVSDEL